MTDFKYEGKDLEAMSFAENYHAWVLTKFKKYLGKRVGEIGAGSGNFSKMLLNEEIDELVSIEPSQEMFAGLVSSTSNEPRIKRLNAFFHEISSNYQNYFDSIVYINVMEHIEDESKELGYIFDSLKVGGRVCIFVPALSWLYSDHDKSIGHYRRYNKKYLRKIVSEAGFEIVTIKYFDILGILPWFIMFKILKNKPNPSSVGFYDTYVVPIAKILESIISIPIGKNLLIVGKKK